MNKKGRVSHHKALKASKTFPSKRSHGGSHFEMSSKVVLLSLVERWCTTGQKTLTKWLFFMKV